MKSKRVLAVAATLLASALFMSSASACFVSNFFKSHSNPQPTSSQTK